MNILLNIPDEIVGKYQFEAEQNRRSRKNLMEKVLVDYFNQPSQVQDLTKSNVEIKPAEQPKSNYAAVVQPAVLPNFDSDFEAQIEGAKDYKELEKVVKKIDTAPLSWKRKVALKGLAESTRNQKGFYND